MSTANVTKRNYGIDLLRILAMIGIIGLHLTGNDIGSSVFRITSVRFIKILFYCTVDIFGIVSGYLGIYKKKATVYRATELCGIVLFYSVIITACFFVCTPSLISVKQTIKGIFPPLAGRYWYIVCFIPVFLLQPYINKMLLALPEKQHLSLCILIIAVFSVLPSVTTVDFFVFSGGYSFVWLLALYVLGACIKRLETGEKYVSFKHIKLYSALVFFCCTVLLLAGNMFIYIKLNRTNLYLVSYVSPFVLAMAISALLIFKGINFSRDSVLLKRLSSTAFDVYIIHAHIFMMTYLIPKAVLPQSINALLVPFIYIAMATAIYLLCSVVSFVRIFIFDKLYITKLICLCSQKLDKVLYPGFE